jgi:hypothetical protein
LRRSRQQRCTCQDVIYAAHITICTNCYCNCYYYKHAATCRQDCGNIVPGLADAPSQTPLLTVPGDAINYGP